MNFRRLAGANRTMIAVGAVILVWFAFAYLNARIFNWVNPNLLPGPIDVVESGIETARTGELQGDILSSLSRIGQGFVIAGVVGVLAAFLVSVCKPVAFFVEPLIEVLRPIPPLAFLPMLVLWFGIGEFSKVFFIAYSAFFPIFITSVEGVKHVDPVLMRAANSLGATRTQMFRYVILPAALPSIFTGLRLGVALSFFVIVAAEFLGADSGLGYLINNARTYFMVSQMLFGAAVVGFFGYIVNWLLKSLEAKALAWREELSK
jgi:ABC-type nitrate/sulfonate/bicarbonate transport system permease component